jgi:hypothetical protein
LNRDKPCTTKDNKKITLQPRILMLSYKASPSYFESMKANVTACNIRGAMSMYTCTSLTRKQRTIERSLADARTAPVCPSSLLPRWPLLADGPSQCSFPEETTAQNFRSRPAARERLREINGQQMNQERRGPFSRRSAAEISKAHPENSQFGFLFMLCSKKHLLPNVRTATKLRSTVPDQYDMR